MDNDFTYLEEVTDPTEGTTDTGGANGDTGSAGNIDLPEGEPIPDNPITDVPSTEPVPDNLPTDTPPATEPVEGSTPIEGNAPVPTDKEQTGTTEPIYTEVIEIIESVFPRYFLDTPIDDYSVTEGFLLVICLLLLVQIAFRK